MLKNKRNWERVERNNLSFFTCKTCTFYFALSFVLLFTKVLSVLLDGELGKGAF